jgi:hypothetical protein
MYGIPAAESQKLTQHVLVIGDHVPTHAAHTRLLGHGLHGGCASGQQITVRNLLEFVNPAAVQAEIFQSCGCDCLLMFNALRGIGLAVIQSTAALRDRTMKKALCGRHLHQASDLAAAARLPEDCYIHGIPAEGFDVVANPLKGSHQVGHARITGVRVLRAIS